MTVRVYKSTDASAPVLSGTVGALIALLDACLVTGYGALAGAGWTKPFTGTNTAVFRNSASAGTGFYLDVNDNGPGAGGAREARIRGYETMTAVATGTNPFPTVAQHTNGLFVRKSLTLDATARAWTLVADETVFYLFVESGDKTAPVEATVTCFGDFFSYKTADAYRCGIVGRDLENSGASVDDNFSDLTTAAANLADTQILYVARSWTGIGGSIAVGHHIDVQKSGTLSSTSDCIGAYSTPNLPYPNGPDAGLYLCPLWIHHNSAIRGYRKGIWAPLHHRPLNHGDTFSGTGAFAGKTFLVQDIFNANSNAGSGRGQIVIETSNTWS